MIFSWFTCNSIPYRFGRRKINGRCIQLYLDSFHVPVLGLGEWASLLSVEFYNVYKGEASVISSLGTRALNLGLITVNCTFNGVPFINNRIYCTFPFGSCLLLLDAVFLAIGDIVPLDTRTRFRYVDNSHTSDVLLQRFS